MTRVRERLSLLLTTAHEWWAKRSADQKIALGIGIPTVILGLLAVVVAIITPEIRAHLGLDHPQPSSETPTNRPTATPQEEIHKPVPEEDIAKPLPPVKPRRQPPLIAADRSTSENDGKKSNVSPFDVAKPPVLNSNAARYDAPSPSTVNQGPGSVAQIGGSGNQATVNNYGPVPRHLSESQKTALIECLGSHPGKFSILAIANNSEAYEYAKDWRQVFLAAGWEIEHKDIPIQIFSIGGGMWSGLHVSVHDASVVEGKIEVLEGSPEKHFYDCGVTVGNIHATFVPYRDMPTGVVRIQVSDRP